MSKEPDDFELRRRVFVEARAFFDSSEGASREQSLRDLQTAILAYQGGGAPGQEATMTPAGAAVGGEREKAFAINLAMQIAKRAFAARGGRALKIQLGLADLVGIIRSAIEIALSEVDRFRGNFAERPKCVHADYPEGCCPTCNADDAAGESVAGKDGE